MVVGQPVVIQAAAVEVDPKNEMPSNQEKKSIIPSMISISLNDVD